MMMQLAASRRERKKQATRQALCEAAFALVEEHGLAGVTVEAIADRADVAPRTFFNYFACKEDAILDRDPERVEHVCRELLDRPASEDPMTALRRVMEAEAARRALDADRTLRRMQLIRSEPQLRATMAAISDEMERALIDAVAERTGQSPDDLYPALLVTETWGVLKVAHMHWSQHGGKIPYERVLAEAFDTLARGLTPQPRPRRRPASSAGRGGEAPTHRTGPGAGPRPGVAARKARP